MKVSLLASALSVDLGNGSKALIHNTNHRMVGTHKNVSVIVGAEDVNATAVGLPLSLGMVVSAGMPEVHEKSIGKESDELAADVVTDESAIIGDSE